MLFSGFSSPLMPTSIGYRMLVVYCTPVKQILNLFMTAKPT